MFAFLRSVSLSLVFRCPCVSGCFVIWCVYSFFCTHRIVHISYPITQGVLRAGEGARQRARLPSGGAVDGKNRGGSGVQRRRQPGKAPDSGAEAGAGAVQRARAGHGVRAGVCVSSKRRPVCVACVFVCFVILSILVIPSIVGTSLHLSVLY